MYVGLSLVNELFPGVQDFDKLWYSFFKNKRKDKTSCLDEESASLENMEKNYIIMNK